MPPVACLGLSDLALTFLFFFRLEMWLYVTPGVQAADQALTLGLLLGHCFRWWTRTPCHHPPRGRDRGGSSAVAQGDAEDAA